MICGSVSVKISQHHMMYRATNNFFKELSKCFFFFTAFGYSDFHFDNGNLDESVFQNIWIKVKTDTWHDMMSVNTEYCA